MTLKIQLVGKFTLLFISFNFFSFFYEILENNRKKTISYKFFEQVTVANDIRLLHFHSLFKNKKNTLN